MFCSVKLSLNLVLNSSSGRRYYAWCPGTFQIYGSCSVFLLCLVTVLWLPLEIDHTGKILLGWTLNLNSLVILVMELVNANHILKLPRPREAMELMVNKYLKFHRLNRHLVHHEPFLLLDIWCGFGFFHLSLCRLNI